uniref:Uncharacterized protein n=1 Tax=Amphimedon queenslandica TaxID=400682 RepID=A0A1X7SIS9_AMPQE
MVDYYQSVALKDSHVFNGDAESVCQVILDSPYDEMFFVPDDTPIITGSNDTVPTTDTINIFSVASGHLYERFLRLGV